MTPIVHTIDPDYDTIIVLTDGSTEFAPWPADEVNDTLPVGEPNTVPSSANTVEDIHYHVSSRHLQLASRWFKRGVTRLEWTESKTIDGRYKIWAHDWDEEAFLLLLNIVHSRTITVPRDVSLEVLAKIAVLLDYYECSDAIEFFTSLWIDHFNKSAVPTTFCRDLVLWIWVAWFFNLPDRFETATAVAIQACTKAMDTLGLPIPSSVTSGVDLNRCQAIETIMSGMHGLLGQYRSSDYICGAGDDYSFQCGAIMLGALTKELDKRSLLNPLPGIPFVDMSIHSLRVEFYYIKTPLWYSSNSNGNLGSYSNSGVPAHACDLKRAVSGIIGQGFAKAQGLNLSGVRGASKEVPGED